MARGRLIVWLGLIVAIASGVPTSASAANLGVPPGFALPASNGYSIHALAFDGDRSGKPDALILFVTGSHGGATYFVRREATVTESTISASLGDLGSIDLHFVPSGKTRSETSACNQRPIEFDSGFYEGVFDFRGEEGYTEAHRSRARGELRTWASLICSAGSDEGSGGHAPGARLRLRRRWEGGKLEFEATKNSPTRPSRFRAELQEPHGDIAVVRAVSDEAGAAAFRFDVRAQSALVRPPSPFDGSAVFLRSGRQPGRLLGHLTLDFPGHSDVPLQGSHGSLQRWVQNPSHPFRPGLQLPGSPN